MKRTHLLFVLLLTSCSSNLDSNLAKKKNANMMIENADYSKEEQVGNSNLTSKSNKSKKLERKLIRQGNIRLKVKNTKQTKFLIAREVEKLNGYLGNESVYQEGTSKESRLDVHVPANKFNRLVEFIEKHADKIDDKTITIDDVSEEFVDLTARLRTKKEVLERFHSMLTRAKNIDEIIKLEEKIGEIQSDIESVEGRLQYIEQNVAFSTLSLVYYTETPAVVVDEPNRFTSAFSEGWESLLSFLVGIARNWFTFLILGVIIYFFRRPIKYFFNLIKMK
ncbi:MAG: DUF4349 domain-containing protein [Fluviicola sp.]